MCNICAHIVNFVYLFCTINTMCYCRLQLFIAQNPFLEAQNVRFQENTAGRAAAGPVNLQSSYQIHVLVCIVFIYTGVGRVYMFVGKFISRLSVRPLNTQSQPKPIGQN